MSTAENNLRDHFKSIANKVCKKVWRIEKNKGILQEKGNFGVFYSKECYVVVKTWKEQDNIRTDLHLWSGEDVSKIKSLNVLNLINDSEDVLEHVTLYRQTQFNETREFLDLFPKGVKYLTGLHKEYRQFQDGEYVKRLFQIKGKRNVRVIQVPLKFESLNEGDSFLLDDEWSIYIWNGKKSSKVERLKALEVGQTIRDEFCYGKAQIIIADQNIDRKEERLFFLALGGSKGEVAPEIEDNKDETDGSFQIKPEQVKLYSVSDESGEIEVKEITEHPLHKEMLHTKDCFIVDGGLSGIYVWVGMRCTREEQQQALKYAVKFLDDFNYPVYTAVTRITEGNETRHFKSYFDKWPEKKFMTMSDLPRGIESHIELVEKNHSNEFGLHIKSIERDMIDAAHGPIRIWRVEGSYKISWPTEYYGVFYEADVYIVQYKCPNQNNYIIYIWHGSKSDRLEQENGRKLAQEIDRKLKGRATQINVVYGKEPIHFLQLFRGRMVILMGGVDSTDVDEETVKQKENSTNRNVFQENDNEEQNNKIFFKISGDHVLNTKAVQLPPKASLLQSDDVFLLIYDDINYLWKGKLASDFEINYAEVVADRLSTEGDMIIFHEGYEPPQFWMALGGKTNYNNKKKKNLDQSYFTTALFHCSNASGTFKITQIKPFDQMDLNSDDVMLLDAFTEIFLWIGEGANEEEKQQAWHIATEFIKNSGRSIDETFITQVKQGLEPESFVSHFMKWEKNKTQSCNYSQQKKNVRQENLFQKDPSNNFKKRSVTWGDQRILKRAPSRVKK